jgi:hypothetical protein
VLCLLLLAPQPAHSQTYLHGYEGPYRGTVLDAETKQPLPGAVVLGVWMHVKIVPLHSSTIFYAARETVAQADGTFLLEARDIEENAPERTYPPYFEVYVPGYAPYRSSVFRTRGSRQGWFTTGAVIALPRLKDREERLKNLPSPHSYFISTKDLGDAPFVYAPRLVESINAEAVSLGLQPYPIPARKP